MQEKVNDILKIVCGVVGETFGETPDFQTLFSVKEKNVKRNVSIARQFAHYTLHRVFGYSVTFIARMTNTTRTNVFANVRKCERFTEIYNDYRNIKEKIKEKYTKHGYE